MGLLLLTGGRGRRLGAPKHNRPHPGGGSWAGHLVRVFEQVFPGGPVQVLGSPIHERPELGNLEDPHQGPARALTRWAAGSAPQVSRWWVPACDQVRWTPSRLEAWWALAAAADPGARAWVLAEHEGRIQFLGGFLGASLLPGVAASTADSLRGLTGGLPVLLLSAAGTEWLDVDSPEDLESWGQ